MEMGSDMKFNTNLFDPEVLVQSNPGVFSRKLDTEKDINTRKGLAINTCNKIKPS